MNYAGKNNSRFVNAGESHKKMTRHALFVLTLVSFALHVCSIFTVVEAKNVPQTDVLYEIKHDQEVCKSGVAFADSKYAKICNNVKYPIGNVTLDTERPNDAEQFLCLGLYDRIVRICHLDSIRKTKKVQLPDNATKFDTEIEKSLPKDASGILAFCANWKNQYPPRYSRTKLYVAQLESQLKDPLLCMKLCTTGPNFIPLCSTLERIDRLSEFTGIEPDKDETSDAEPTQTQAAQQETTSGNDKVQTAGADAGPPGEAAKTEKVDLPDESPDVVKELPEDPKIDSKLEKPEPDEHKEKTKVSSLVPADTKKVKVEPKQQTEKIEKASTSVAAANAATEEQKEKVNSAKEDLMGKPTEEKAPQTKSDNLADSAKVSDAVPPSVDGASAPQNQGTLGDDDNDAVISQNTQDRPDDADSQEVQDNPIDTDGAAAVAGALPNDDNEQRAIEPSEQREYSPHMPSIAIEDDSHFFGYFTVIGVICIAGYVGYHNKQKILAMVVEGRRSRGGRSRRRPSTANYRKLDCTLEEAVTSQCNSNVTHVIY